MHHTSTTLPVDLSWIRTVTYASEATLTVPLHNGTVYRYFTVPRTILNPAGAMMAASIAVTGATLAPGAPVALFPTRIVGGGVELQGQGRQYDVAPDGRFLINTMLDEAAAPVTLIQNWQPDAKK